MTSNDRIHVLVVGARTVERKGLSSLLNSLPTLIVVGEAANGQEAVLMARESHPDIVLMDDVMFYNEGPGPIWRIWQESPDVAVLVLCESAGTPSPTVDFDSGRLGFIRQDAAPKELTSAIQDVIKRVKPGG